MKLKTNKLYDAGLASKYLIYFMPFSLLLNITGLITNLRAFYFTAALMIGFCLIWSIFTHRYIKEKINEKMKELQNAKNKCQRNCSCTWGKNDNSPKYCVSCWKLK